ncbi:ABC transporter ATP-binding protein [Amaricoccus sp.]|uniref:ABC transporter ATP-binding protein n=1 Tax=Amaricoccus sp. TaxID=1872485 RepID=UPI002620D967|nr:ABC transporter ATP-binding protein [Amaricoccus sp.]HRO11386.1 ABC transporter ATP-binding protein [Amaricoccus sp.]
MANIGLRGIEKYFGANYVIRQLNLEIADGEFVVLLGPSGCGKTTTLRAIAGLEEIDSGLITIDERPVQDLPPGERDIAFVFQLFALYPHLTAFENIAFPLRATGETRAEIERKVKDVAASLRIEPLLAKRPSALSGGDLQRVAIGRALVRRPKALLMDEPIGALDAKLREDMRAELKRLHIENGTTSVYVTHDQVEAMSLADRVAVMNDGVLQQVGTPSEVYLHPVNLFVAQFVGSPVMNIVPAEIRPDGAETAVAIGGGPAFAFPGELAARLGAALPAGHELVVGVRPEAVRVAREAAPGLRPVEAHFIEPLGAYDIVDLKVGERLIKARTPSGFVRRPGEAVWARLDVPQVHFFDATSGDVLKLEPAHG